MGIVRKDGMIMTILSFAGAGIGFLSKVLLFPKYLKPEEVGLANVLLGISGVYAQSSLLGMHMTISKFFPYFKDHNNKHNGILFWCLSTAIFGFIIFTFIFYLNRGHIISYYSPHSPLLAQYYYLIIPMGLSSLLLSFFDGYLRILYKNLVIQFLNEVATRILVVLAVVLYILHYLNFREFIFVYAGTYGVLGFVALGYTMYIGEFYFNPIFNRLWLRLRKYVVRYSSFLYVAAMSNAYLGNMDVIMVAGIASLHDTGIYSTIFFLTTVMQIPYRAITKVAGTQVAYLWRHKEIKEIQKLYVQVSEVCFVIGAVFFLGVWVNIKDIISFMPPEYMRGVQVFLIVGFGRLFDMSTGINGHIILYSNKYGNDIWFTFILIISSFFLNVWLIPIFGITGAALAAAFVLFLYNSLRLWYIWKSYKLFPFNKRFILPLIWFFILTIICHFLPHFFNRYFDIPLKGIMACLLFVLPMYYWKFSTDLNKMVVRFISK